MEKRALLTGPALFWQLADLLADSKNKPFDFVVVDEAQDITPAQLRFVAALGAGKADGLFFAGDLGQRIFQQPFSWKSLGIDIRGRSRILKINYRTSHQIRAQADRLLSPEISDVDGNTESRGGTISAFNGESPQIHTLDDEQEEREFVADWIRQQLSNGLAAHEIGLFVRSAGQLDRAVAAAKQAACAYKVLDEHFELAHGSLTISTMHLAKGLEFRAVGVMACDDEVIPLQARIEAIGDEADLEEVYNTERHLLYVACTRARDYLLITAVDPASEFLDDLLEN